MLDSWPRAPFHGVVRCGGNSGLREIGQRRVRQQRATCSGQKRDHPLMTATKWSRYWIPLSSCNLSYGYQLSPSHCGHHLWMVPSQTGLVWVAVLTSSPSPPTPSGGGILRIFCLVNDIACLLVRSLALLCLQIFASDDNLQ